MCLTPSSTLADRSAMSTRAPYPRKRHPIRATWWPGWAPLSGTKTGGEPQEQTYPHVDSLRTLIEAFADAVEGRAPFPVTPEQMLDVIGAFEAVIASLAKGAPGTLR